MREKKKRRRGAGRIVLLVLIALVLAFFGLFYITDVEVVGNSRYTESQIREMAMQGPISVNSVLMTTLRRKIRPSTPFIELIETEYKSRNKIRLTVHEKYPIGYVVKEGYRYYFDQEGLVLEAIEDTSTDSADETEAISASPIEDSVQDARNEEDTAFRPALTDVPRIEGLGESLVTVGQQIQVEDPQIFQVILSLSKLIDKFAIRPERVQILEDGSLQLRYEEIDILLGTDENLEEKLARAAAILPDLGGRKGTLHLESYTKDMQNVVFDSEGG